MTATGTQSGPSRNAPCPCGSGKKYKRCCGQTAAGRPAATATSPDKLQQVIRHYQQGNLPAAGQLAEQLLRSNPNDAGLIEISAAVALQTGNAALAAERFTQQTRLQPDNALAHSNLCMALHTLGRDEEAFLNGQQATQLDPQLADAWNNLGNVYKSGNNLEGANEHYEKALALQPDDPEILVNSGSVKQLLGDTDTAEQYYHRAIQLYPQFAPAHNNLGTTLKQQEHYDEAEQAFKTALRLQPGNPEYLTNLGTLMGDRARVDEARDYLQQALQADPEYVGAWVSMGNLLERLNDQDDAQRHFDKALLLDPENATVLCNMGQRLFDKGEQKEAIEHFVRALKNNPNSAKALAGLGRAMLREDRVGKAAGYIEKALALAPWDPHAHMAMAGLHEVRNEVSESEAEWLYVTEHWPRMPDGHIGLATHYMGQEDYDSARAAYRQAEENNAISPRLYNSWSQMEEHLNNLDDAEKYARKTVELDPGFPGLKILQATLARRRKDFDTALEILQQVDVDTIAIKQTKSTYLFELGNVQDKLGNYREALAAYKEGNDLKNHFVGRVYDETDDNNKFRTLRNVFSSENWQRLAQLGDADEAVSPQPVFIVGFPRSGTSLLEQILGSHREIAPAGELTYILRSADTEAARLTGSKQPFPALLLDDEHPLDRATVHALRDYYLTSATGKAVGVDDNTRWITDKMPHNAKYVGLIRMLFPKSPIIHISRHPLNPCLSAYFSNFKSTHRYTSSLEATAMHYRNMMDMLDHYRDIGIDFMEVHYEDLVKDQENVTRKLLDYIGAPWDPNCLQHHKSDRVVRTASYEQVTQKVYTSSLNRYQNYWEGVQGMIPILQSTIERFGYTVEPPPAEQ